MSSLYLTLLVIALGIDLFSLFLNLRRAIVGHGASGVPFISLYIYFALTEWMGQLFFFDSPGHAFVFLAVFHLFCHLIMPIALHIRKRFGRC